MLVRHTHSEKSSCSDKFDWGSCNSTKVVYSYDFSNAFTNSNAIFVMNPWKRYSWKKINVIWEEQLNIQLKNCYHFKFFFNDD